MSASGPWPGPTEHPGTDDPQDAEIPRRTWLAAERTWLKHFIARWLAPAPAMMLAQAAE